MKKMLRAWAGRAVLGAVLAAGVAGGLSAATAASAAAAENGTVYVVHGVPGLTVQLVDKNVGGDQVLYSTHTGNDGSYAFSGTTPPTDDFRRIVRALNGTAAGKIFATDRIGSLADSNAETTNAHPAARSSASRSRCASTCSTLVGTSKVRLGCRRWSSATICIARPKSPARHLIETATSA